MISFYDDYTNRIEKLAKVKRKLHKLRFVICGALALVIGGSLGLMFAKGSYTSEMELSATTVNFNESFEVTPAKAFLCSASSQTIEYSGEDGKWTEEKPYRAGTYKVRTVTPKLVGYSYSKPVTLQILPLDAELKILSDSITYGEVPDCTVTLVGGGSLVNGHTLQTGELTFTYDNRDFPTSNRAEVTVDKSSIVILDPVSGEDFTDCYKITNPVKQIAVTNRRIEVQPAPRSITYEGKGVEIENVLTDESLAFLAKGDEIRFTTNVLSGNTKISEAVTVGAYDLLADKVSIWHGETEVTSLYDVNFLHSELLITRRRIGVFVSGKEKEYDGTELRCAEFTTDGNLAEGHSIVLQELSSITSVGTAENLCRVAVMNGTEAVTENYEVIAEFGWLTVMPRRVTVTTASDQKIYDGTALSNTHFTTDDKGPFEYRAEGYTEITDYGDKENKFKVTAWLDDEEVTLNEQGVANFAFEYEYGILRINKRPVEVTTGSLTAHYNGVGQTNEEAFASEGGEFSGLLEGHELSLYAVCSVVDVTGADGEDNTTEYHILAGGVDVTDNYAISYKYGKIIITPRPIVVQVKDYAHVYDGQEHYSTEYDTFYRDDESLTGLVKPSDALVATGWTALTDFGEEVNKVSYTAPANGNYVIVEVRDGKISITKRQIIVTTATREWEYDGNTYSDTSYVTVYAEDETQPGLMKVRDELTPKEGYKQVREVKESGANDVDYDLPNDNYEIFEIRFGTLTVTPRGIVVVTFDGVWVYDGEAHSKTGYDTKWIKDETQKGLVEGDVLRESTNYSEIINVADPDPKNRVSFNNDPNYTIEREDWGTLTIKPRPIKVITATAEWTYDGQEHSAEELDESLVKTYFVDEDGNYGDEIVDIQGHSAGLVLDGEALTLLVSTGILNVGETPNACLYAVPNGNYEIEGYEFGTLTITVRHIKVVTASNTWVYDGEAHSDTTYTTYQVNEDGEKLSDEGLVNGDVLAVDTDTVTTILNYGSTANTTQYTVIPVSDGYFEYLNYSIYGYDEGTLEILKRTVTLKIDDHEEVYGNPIPENGYTFAEGEGLYGFAEGDIFTIDYIYKQSDVIVTPFDAGTYTITYSAIYINGEDAFGNYDLTIEDGTLTVTPLKITVIFEDQTYTYGTYLYETDFPFKLEGVPYWAWRAANVHYTGVEVDGYEEVMWLDTVHYEGFEGKDYPKNVGQYTVYATADDFAFCLLEKGAHGATGIIRPASNYDIVEIRSGTLTIVPKEITVELNSIEQSTVTYGKTFTYAEGIGNYKNADDLELAFREKLQVAVRYKDANGNYVTPKNAGAYSAVIDIDNCIFYDKDGTALVNEEGNFGVKNYTIICEDEITDLTIEPKRIRVYLLDYTVTYGEYTFNDSHVSFEGDDTPYDLSSIGNYKTEDKGEDVTPALEYGEQLRIIRIGYLLDSNAVLEYVPPRNVGTYRIGTYWYYGIDPYVICDENGELIEGGNKNYWLDGKNGKLTINPRPVTVKIDDQEEVYGNALPENKATVAEGSLGFAYGEELTLDYFYKLGDDTVTPFDAGTYTITYSAKYINGDVDGLDNYDLTVVDGTLTITPRELYITIMDATYTYGEAITGNGNQFAIAVDGGLYEGPWLGKTYVHGLLFISDMDTGLIEFIWLDTVHFEGFEDGTYPKNVGTYTVTATESDFHFSVRRDPRPASNYDIVEIKSGTLTIVPMEITVELNPIEQSTVTYGQTFAYTAGIGNYKNADDLELAFREKLQVAVRYKDANGNYVTPKNVGKYSAEIDIDNCIFYDEYGTPLVEDGDNFGVKNYTIICEDLTDLTIEQKWIDLYLLDYTVTYGDYTFEGDDHPYDMGIGNHKTGVVDGKDYTPALEYGEQIEITRIIYCYYDHEITSSVPCTPRNVGSYSISFNRSVEKYYEIYDENGELIEDGNNNYRLGTAYYSGALTINPKEITVNLSDFAVEYGDEINYPAGEGDLGVGNYKGGEFAPDLSYGDTLKVNGVTYHVGNENNAVEHFNKGEYIIALNGGYTLYNSEGEEIPVGNYEITTIVGTLTVLPRQVTVSSLDRETEYGKSLPENDFAITFGAIDEAGNLPYGETLDVSYHYELDGEEVTTPVDAGAYDIIITINAVLGDFGSFGNYSFSYEYGTLVIKRLKITLTYYDVTYIYGEYFDISKNKFVIGLKWDITSENKPVDGEELKYTVTFEKDGVSYGAHNPPINVGIYQICVEDAYIEGGQGRLENYAVTYELGKFVVEKYAILIFNTEDIYSAVYGSYDLHPEIDFETYTDYGTGDLCYTFYYLPYNEILLYLFTFTDEDGNTYSNLEDYPLKAGTYDIKLEIVDIDTRLDFSGGTLENYDIYYEWTNPKLIITPLEVTVSIENMTATYGDTVGLPEMTVVADTEDGLLPYGEEFTYTILIDDREYNGKSVTAGEHKLELRVATAGVTADGVNNYTITYNSATLTVEKKEIHVSLRKDVEWDYGTYEDGEAPETFTAEEGSLAFDERLDINVVYYDEYGTNPIGFPKDAGQYVIKAWTFTVYSDEEENNPYGELGYETKAWNKLTNYVIYCEDGLLTVNQRAVTITIDSHSSGYGNALPENGFEVTEGALAYEERITLDYIYKQGDEEVTPVNVGLYTITYSAIYVDGDEELVANYDLTVINGSLFIAPKAVTVTITDKTCYYGDELPELNPEIVGMAEGETLKLTFKLTLGGNEYALPVESRLDAGVYTIAMATESVEGGQGLLSNYDISYDNLGRVEIKPIEVSVTILGDTVTYGRAFAKGYAVTSDKSFLEDELFEFSLNFEKDGVSYNDTDNLPKNAGVYKITVANEWISGGNGKVSNYAITYADNNPELIILPAEVAEIKLNDKVSDFTYGDDYNSSITDVEVFGVEAYGEKITVKVKYSFVADGAGAAPVTPKNVGAYRAELDWENCTVLDSDGNEIEGGINNYYEPDCVQLLFSISKFKFTVTVASNSWSTYGDELPAIASYPNRELPYGETFKVAYGFEKDGVSYDQEDNKPRAAGVYNVIAKSVSFFSGSESADAGNYEEVEFVKNNPTLTIEKRSIAFTLLQDLKFGFGETGVYPVEAGNYLTQSGLAEGDVLTVTGVKFVKLDAMGNKTGAAVYAPTDAGVYAIQLEEFKVTYGDVDVTDCYDLSVCGEGRLEISASIIRVKSADGEWEYDGTRHTVTEYGEITPIGVTLPEGYTIVVDELFYVKDVTDGTPNETTFKVLYNGGNTDNFQIVVVNGTFVVTKRAIVIKTESNTKAYDGTALDGKTESNPDGYTVSYAGWGDNLNAFGEGDSLKVKSTVKVTDASAPVDNVLGYDIVDGAGSSVLSNYEIYEEWGTLQVTPLRVRVSISDVSTIYGEQIEVTFKTYIDDKEAELPNGEQFKFETGIFNNKTYTEIIPVIADGYVLVDAGTYALSFKGDLPSGITVIGGKLSNYDVTEVAEGRLTVSAREIIVVTRDGGMDGEWMYDGEEHSMPKYDTYLASERSEPGLLGGAELQASGWSSIVNVGETQNYAKLTVPNKNYEIVADGITYGTLKVVARRITVLTATVGADGSIIYDGTAHSEDASGNTTDTASLVEGTSLVFGHRLVLKGAAFSYVNATGYAGVDNVNEYKVVDDKGNDGVNSNYAITVKYGSLIILPRPITIKSNDVNAVYDGMVHADNGFSRGEDSEYWLVEGHVISASGSASVYDVTVYDFPMGMPNILNYKIYDGSGNEVTDNYSVGMDVGRIVVTPAELTVTLVEGLSLPYGDLSFVNKLLQSADGLIEGERFTAAFTFDRELTGIGNYTATLDWNNCTVTNARNTVGIRNYSLSVATVRTDFEVTVRQLSFQPATGVTAAYGENYEPLLTKDWNFDRSFGVENAIRLSYYDERLVLALAYSVPNPVNKGTYSVWIDWANSKVYDKNGNLKVNGIDNYELESYASVTFEITPATLVVSMDDIGTVKYGEAYSYPDAKGNYKSAVGLAYGEDIRVLPVYMLNGVELAEAPAFAGVYQVAFKAILQVYDRDGNPVTGGAENYKVICNAENYGYLEITGVNVTVTRQNISVEYNGQPYVLAERNCPETEVTLSYVTADGVQTTLPSRFELRLKAPFATPADAGSYANAAEYVIWDTEADAESGEYVISAYGDNGTAKITINKKVVKLTTYDATKVYDGTALQGEYTLGEPVSGHTYKIATRASVINVTAEPVDNVITFIFFDGDGNDVTKNYEVENYDERGVKGEYGKLQVTAREVTVTLGDDMTTVYGEEFTVKYTLTSGGTAFSFPEGERFTFGVRATVGGIAAERLTVGTYAIEYFEGSAKINGAEVTNYAITFANHGTLEVKVRAITVTTVSDTWVYDGEVHSAPDYDDGLDYTYYLDGEGNKQPALVEGDALVAKAGYTTVKDYNGGGVPNEVQFEENENYQITLIYGTLKVTKRTVTIVTGSAEKTYDGEWLSNGEIEECYYTDEGGNRLQGIVGGDRLALVGDAFTVINATDEGGVENKNEYEILDALGEKSNNYDITYVYGTLIINRAKMTVKLSVKDSYQYGDKSFMTDAFTVADEDIIGLVEGEILTVSVAIYLDGTPVGEPKNVAQGYEVRLDKTLSTVNNGRAGKGINNYEITCESVYFDITKKDVTVELLDWDPVTYDGTSHDEQEGKLVIPADAFEYGETLTPVYAFLLNGEEVEPVNAGTYKVTLSLEKSTMSDGDGNTDPLQTNYNVTFKTKEFVDFKINSRAISIRLNTAAVVYDGSAHDLAELGAYTLTNFIDGDEHELVLDYYKDNVKIDGAPVNEGTYNVKISDLICSDNYTFDLSGIAYGKLTIAKREITVTIATKTVEAHQAEYTYEDISHYFQEENGQGFVNDDLQRALATGELTFIYGDSSATEEDIANGIISINTVTLGVVTGSILNNYTILSVEEGERTVVQTQIAIYISVKSKVYDGETVAADDFTMDHTLMDDPFTPAYTDDDLANITLNYDIVNEETGASYWLIVKGDGTVIQSYTPANAGKYNVTLRLEGAPVRNYYIYNPTIGLVADFTIERRKLNVEITPDGDFVTSAEYGDFDISMITDYVSEESVKVVEGDENSGFVGGVIPQLTFGLVTMQGMFVNSTDYARYDAGEYFVSFTFEDASNYDISAVTYGFTIKPRLLVIAPTAPDGKTNFDYVGYDLYLQGSEGYYKILRGSLLEGDTLIVTTTKLSASKTEGVVYIELAEINGGFGNANYRIYFNQSMDEGVSDIPMSRYSLKLSFNIVTIQYEQILTGGDNGWQFNYDGTAHDITIPNSSSVAGSLIRLIGANGKEIENYELPYGLKVALTRSTFSFTDAGVYENWFNDRLQVVGATGKVGCYVLENLTDPDTDAFKVFVTKQTITVKVTADRQSIEDGTALADSEIDENKKLVEGLTITGLLPEHECEVLVFNVEDTVVLGVTVFINNKGKRKDVITNYDCVVAADSVYGLEEKDGVVIRFISVDDIKTLSRPVLRVNLPDVAYGDLLDESYSTWTDGIYYLNGVTHSAFLNREGETHELMTVVYGVNGKMTVGIVVIRNLDNGGIADASNLYNVIWNELTGVDVNVLTYAEYKSLVRTIKIDLTQSFMPDGSPDLDENDRLNNVSVTGLMQNANYTHCVEIIYTGEGFDVIIYQKNVLTNRVVYTDKQSVYDFILVLPDGSALSENDFVRVNVSKYYTN